MSRRDGVTGMSTEQVDAASPVEASPTVIIPSCTERDFFETIFPYHRLGTWSCIYCGEPIEYTNARLVYIGRRRLPCRVEEIGGFFQLCPVDGASVAVNRCCSDRIAAADAMMPRDRVITCPICGDTYTSAMVARWQGSSRVHGYTRDGVSYAVDHDLAVPALMPVDRVMSRPR
jgi:hypothetical protein